MANESPSGEPTKVHPKPGPQHSLKTLKRAVRELGARTLDRRTKVWRALGTWAGLAPTVEPTDHY